MHCEKGPENCDECETVEGLREHVGEMGVYLLQQAAQCIREARAFVRQADPKSGSEYADLVSAADDSLLESFNWIDEALAVARRVAPERFDNNPAAPPVRPT